MEIEVCWMKLMKRCMIRWCPKCRGCRLQFSISYVIQLLRSGGRYCDGVCLRQGLEQLVRPVHMVVLRIYRGLLDGLLKSVPNTHVPTISHSQKAKILPETGSFKFGMKDISTESNGRKRASIESIIT